MNQIAVYIILPNNIKEKLVDKLNRNGFECTLLSTTGAYLRAGQTTILTIIEMDKIDALKDLIEATKVYHNENYAEKVKGILFFSVPVIDFDVM